MKAGSQLVYFLSLEENGRCTEDLEGTWLDPWYALGTALNHRVLRREGARIVRICMENTGSHYQPAYRECISDLEEVAEQLSLGKTIYISYCVDDDWEHCLTLHPVRIPVLEALNPGDTIYVPIYRYYGQLHLDIAAFKDRAMALQAAAQHFAWIATETRFVDYMDLRGIRKYHWVPVCNIGRLAERWSESDFRLTQPDFERGYVAFVISYKIQ